MHRYTGGSGSRSGKKSGTQPFQESQKKVGGIDWRERVDSASIREDVNSLIDVTRTVAGVILDKMLDIAELEVVRATHVTQFNELAQDFLELRTQMYDRFDAMARYNDGFHVWVRNQYQHNRWNRAHGTLDDLFDRIGDHMNDLSDLIQFKYEERLEIDRYQQGRRKFFSRKK